MNQDTEKTDQRQRLAIDWSSVVTNSVSALVAAVFVGAGAIVWTATVEQDKRIQERVNAASTNLTLNSIKQEEAQKTLTEEVGALRAALANQRAEIATLASVLTNRTDTAAVAATVSELHVTNRPWDEFVFKGRSNAQALNQQINQQVQQRWDPRQQSLK